LISSGWSDGFYLLGIERPMGWMFGGIGGGGRFGAWTGEADLVVV
jgi:hypothetical protein